MSGDDWRAHTIGREGQPGCAVQGQVGYCRRSEAIFLRSTCPALLVIALPATFDDSTRAARRQQQRRTITMMAASSEKDDDLYAGYAANATQFEDWAASAAAEGEQYVCVHVK